VHEPDIAPLARRLAEENNVDWRRLSGTGDGGRVVERDVLGYLARVMAGEEAVDPTPEPVPEGMEAWPAEDVGGYGGRDLDDEPTSPPTLDDDLFLFDEPAPAEPVAQDDALFVAEEPGAIEAAEAPEAPGDDDEGTVIDASTGGDDEAEGEDGVWLVGDDAADDDERAPEAAPAPEAGEPEASFDLDGAEEGGREARIDELPDLTVGEEEADARAAEDEAARRPGGRDALELPDLFAEADGPRETAAPAGDDLALDAAVAPEPGEAEETGAAVAASDQADEPEAEPTGATATEPAAPPRSADDGRAVAAPAVGQAAAAVSLVRHGQLWRRRFDDRPLRQVASDAAAVLDVAPTSMVLLLMARAAKRAGMADGSLDAWRWRRDGADRGAIDAEAAVREAAQRLESRAVAEHDAPPADLIVADLGDLGVDEAVLHLEAPVLALGRSSADGAWLSLSGDDLDGRAASGLARVAELLAAPVRLLL